MTNKHRSIQRIIYSSIISLVMLFQNATYSSTNIQYPKFKIIILYVKGYHILECFQTSPCSLCKIRFLHIISVYLKEKKIMSERDNFDETYLNPNEFPARNYRKN